jgi:hypothetical protein
MHPHVCCLSCTSSSLCLYDDFRPRAAACIISLSVSGPSSTQPKLKQDEQTGRRTQGTWNGPHVMQAATGAAQHLLFCANKRLSLRHLGSLHLWLRVPIEHLKGVRLGEPERSYFVSLPWYSQPLKEHQS